MGKTSIQNRTSTSIKRQTYVNLVQSVRPRTAFLIYFLSPVMVFGLFSFGKQVLPLFLVQYVVYHIHHVVSTVGHHYCPIAC